MLRSGAVLLFRFGKNRLGVMCPLAQSGEQADALFRMMHLLGKLLEIGHHRPQNPEVWP